MNNELKLCPFCGGRAVIQIRDDEGNLHNEEYEKNPWSGLSYTIAHFHEDNEDCPIARYEEDEGKMGGVYLYDTKEDAIEAWNRRVEQ